jgi:hypothetical protein
MYVCYVAVAAEAGSVVELQKHLDRRKFALSRDRGTAATILHKAVALGHQEVARYSIKGSAAVCFRKHITLQDVLYIVDWKAVNMDPTSVVWEKAWIFLVIINSWVLNSA